MKGIDISAWQTDIDWQAVKDGDIEFVIIKLGQKYQLDSMFVDHINNATDHGLKVGLYYYSRAVNGTQAQSEADWVDAQIKQYLNGIQPEMGIWYDMEDSTITDSGANVTALCQEFINQLKVAGYDYIGVYSSYNWLTNGNIGTDQLDVPYWCAQYNSECNFENPNLRIWQFTDSLEIGDKTFDGNILY